MNNFFKTFQADERSASEQRLHKTLYPSRKASTNEQLALGSYNRANNWAKDKLADNDLLKVLKNGVTPLKHTDWHDFRTPEGEIIDSRKNIYLRKYLPASQRADVAEKDHRSAYLEHTPFLGPKMQQTRIPEKEVGPLIRHGARTQSERLNIHLNGTNRLIDGALTDNKMIYYPDWRDHDKTKWTSPKAFDTTTCLYQGRKALDPWKMVPGGINIGDSYVEGFEVVGDLSRKRHLALETSAKDFLTTVTPNHNSMAFMPPLDSNSIRTSKSAKFIGQGPNADPKTFPKSMRHILTQNPEFNETAKSTPKSSRSSAIPKVIQIKTGIMEPMKESYLSSTGYKTRSDSSPMTDKSFFKTGFAATRRGKNPSPDKGEYIKQAVKSYFD